MHPQQISKTLKLLNVVFLVIRIHILPSVLQLFSQSAQNLYNCFTCFQILLLLGGLISKFLSRKSQKGKQSAFSLSKEKFLLSCTRPLLNCSCIKNRFQNSWYSTHYILKVFFFAILTREYLCYHYLTLSINQLSFCHKGWLKKIIVSDQYFSCRFC